MLAVPVGDAPDLTRIMEGRYALVPAGGSRVTVWRLKR